METSMILKESLRWVINNTQLSFDIKNSLTEDNLKNLYKLSKAHDVAHLVGYFLQKNQLIDCDTEIAKTFKKELNIAIYRYSQIEYELAQFRAELDKSGIPFILLKGAVIRQYYPEPWMRTSCDIDVLVKREDHQKAMKYLEDKLGYKFAIRGSHDVTMKTQSGLSIELHYQLIEEEIFPNAVEILNNVWSYATVKEGCNCEHELDSKMFYFYHVIHMAKHVLNGGTGLRSFIDTYLLNNRANVTVNDNDLLEKAKLKKFAIESQRLASAWFGDLQADEVVNLFESYVLSGGVLGTIENGAVIGQSKKGGKFKYLLARLFPPYSRLKERYPVLKKHWYLTPIFYVVRWFEMIFSGRFNRAVTEVKSMNVDKEKLDETKKLLKDLGL